MQTHTPTQQEALFIALDQYSRYEMRGHDAETFLQGQLTCDVAILETGQSTLGAHCNPKGRVICSYLVTRTASDTFTLKVLKRFAETGLHALKKYMVFSKAELTELENQRSFALIMPEARAHAKSLIAEHTQNHVHETHQIYMHAYSDQLVELWLNDGSHINSLNTMQLSENGCITDWQRALITHGIVDIDETLSEKYLPQELNYHELDAVSFKKGCYTGQEVIARLHYKGKLKKQLHLGELDPPLTSPPALLELVNSTNASTCGEILCHVSSDSKTLFLALISQESAEQNSCAISSMPNTKIQWHPLPYAIT